MNIRRACFSLILLCLVLTGCTRLFFYPMKEHVSAPSQVGFEYQDVFFNAQDGTRLHAWLIDPKTTRRGVVYFLHGNAQNISTHFHATIWLLKSGYQVFAIDYRGYGLSQGKPDIPEVFSDIEAGAQWLEEYLAKDESGADLPVFVFGQSLGASLAITYAQLDERFNERFDGLIAEAAFSRYDSIAKHVASNNWLTWSLQYPVKWMINQQYDPLDAIAELEQTPKLIIHSVDDVVIPYRFGQQLFDAAKEPKLWISTTGPHIRAGADPAVRQAILEFMQDSSYPNAVRNQ